MLGFCSEGSNQYHIATPTAVPCHSRCSEKWIWNWRTYSRAERGYNWSRNIVVPYEFGMLLRQFICNLCPRGWTNTLNNFWQHSIFTGCWGINGTSSGMFFGRPIRLVRLAVLSFLKRSHDIHRFPAFCSPQYVHIPCLSDPWYYQST